MFRASYTVINIEFYFLCLLQKQKNLQKKLLQVFNGYISRFQSCKLFLEMER